MSPNLIEKLDYIISHIETLEKEIIELKADVQNLNDKAIQLIASSNNMDNHISFINRVYDVLKYPFKSIMTYYYYYIEPSENKKDLESRLITVNNLVE